MNVKKIISWTAVILWMVLIFYLSHQPATESKQLRNNGEEQRCLTRTYKLIDVC